MHTDPSIARHAGLAGVPILPLPDIARTSADPFAEDPRPVMTEKDLSLNKAAAGNRAAKEAAGHPEDPVAVAALLDAASGPMQIAGLELKPVTLGTLKTLREVGSSFVADEASPLGVDEISLAILIFADPKSAWLALRNGQIEQLKARAEELAFDLEVPQLRKAGEWINGQLLSLNLLVGDGEDHRPATPEPGPGKPAASCG